MRKKVTLAAMAEGDDSKATQSSLPDSHMQRQDSDFVTSVKRLGRLARSVAQDLCAITYLLGGPSVTTELIPKVYALAAILSSFEDDLILESAVQAGDQKDMWTREHHKNLTRSIRECDHALVDIARAVQIADEQSRVSASVKRGDDYIDYFHLDDGPQVLDTIVECFRLAAQTKVIVRHSALSRVKSLDGNEIQETLRLTRALRYSDLNAIWARKDVLFASKQIHPFSLRSRIHCATRIEPTKEEPAAISNTPGPSPKSEDSTPEREISIELYNQRSPFGNYRCPAYLAKGRDKDNKTLEAPSLSTYGSTSRTIPASIQSIKPLPSSASAPTVESGKVSFGEPSVIKPASSSSLFANIPPSSAFANDSQPMTNASTPRPRLEAYILRPTVQTTEFTSMLSYGDEPLRLSEEVMQTQIRSSGPDYSVIDVLLDLHPQQLRLMQRRAAERHGHIISVQHGKPVNVDTVMSSLQVKPAVYIISTTTVLPQEGTGLSYSTVVTGAPATSTGTSGPGFFGGSIFGAKSPPAPDVGSTNSDSTACAGSNLRSPELYSKYLQEKGELCTYVEGTDCKGRYQYYQTITTNKDWHGKDRSLEEIRLADYKAGRTGPDCLAKTNATSYSWDEPKRMPSRQEPRILGQKVTSIPTEVNISETGWHPKTIRPSAPGHAFADNAPKPGSFTLPEEVASGVSPNMDSWGKLSVVPPNQNPFAHLASNLQSFVPAKEPRSASDSAPPTTGPPLFGADIVRVPPQSSIANSTAPNFHPLFGPPVGVTDPGVTSKWVTHPQALCEIKHVHGMFCRVSSISAPKSPSEDNVTFPESRTEPGTFAGFAVDNFGKAPAFSDTASKTQVPSVSSQFAGSSSDSLFAALTSKTGDRLFGAASAEGSANNPFMAVAESKPSTSPGVGLSSKSNRNGSAPQTTNHFPCQSFGCLTCRPSPVPVHINFDWASTGPRPQSLSWANQPTSILFGPQAAPKPSLFGAAAARQASSTPFGVSASKSVDSPFGKAATEQGSPPVCAMPATTIPSAPSSGGGLFGGKSTTPRPQPVASSSGVGSFGGAAATSEPLLPPCLVNNPFGQASDTLLASQTYYQDPVQAPGCAINTTTHPGPSPGIGLFGGGTVASKSASAGFDQPTGSVSSSAGGGLFGNSGSTAKAGFAGFGQPVKATIAPPGVRWSGGGFGARHSLEDYQRQLRKLEERNAVVRRAETVARKGPHDDAALAALLDSKKPTLINDASGAVLSDNGPEESGVASPFEDSNAARLAALLDSKPASVREEEDAEYEGEREGWSSDVAGDD